MEPKETCMFDAPVAKRLRRSAYSSVVDEQARCCQKLFFACRNFRNEEGRYISDIFFRCPSKKAAPDYYVRIRNPIDLTVVHEKLKSDEYSNVDAFMSDVRLMIENAKEYYEPCSSEYLDACSFWKMMVEERRKLEESGDELSESGLRSRENSPTVFTRSLRSKSSNHMMRLRDNASPISGSDHVSRQVLEQLLATVLTAESGDGRLLCAAFKFVPSRELWPDYYRMIQDPIDLHQIARKLSDNVYKSLNDIESDLNLLCQNARMFNEPMSTIYADASAIRKLVAHKKHELLQSALKPIDEAEMRKNAQVVNELLLCACSSVEPFEQLEDSDEEVNNSDCPIRRLYNLLRYHRDDELGSTTFEEFVRLPDRKVYSNYYQIIAHPMSFLVVNKKIKNGQYRTCTDLLNDIRLMSSNARKYNKENSVIYEKAIRLEVLAFSYAKELGSAAVEQQRLSSQPVERRDINSSSVKSRSQMLGEKSIALLERSKAKRTYRQAFSDYKERLLRVYRSVVDYKGNDGRMLSSNFMEKPSKRVDPEYYRIVLKPVDLATIKASIDADKYDSSSAMAADFDLLFENSKLYYGQGSALYDDAVELSNVFAEAMQTFCPNSTGRPKLLPSRSRRSSKLYYDNSAFSREKAHGADSSRRMADNKGAVTSKKMDEKLWEVYNAIKSATDSSGRVYSDMFVKLPSKSDYPSYYEVIRKPIDLQKISHRLKASYYDGLEALVNDLSLMFNNACKYNDPDSIIYKDAVTLQRILFTKRAELRDVSTSSIVDAQAAVQAMFSELFSTVDDHHDSCGYYYSNSLRNVLDEETGYPLLDIIGRNVHRKRYKRLDRFQMDMFQLFEKARKLHGCGSQTFEDAIELQTVFIQKRDKITNRGEWLYSAALAYTEKDFHLEMEEYRSVSPSGRAAVSNSPRAILPLDATELEQVDVRGVTYKKGSFAYVLSREGCNFQCIQIKRIWQAGANDTFVCGSTYCRAEDTYHPASRKFLQQEVFLSGFIGQLNVENIVGKCIVMSASSYVQHIPAGFDSRDVYVCLSKYVGGPRGRFQKLTAEEEPSEPNAKLNRRVNPLIPKLVPYVTANSFGDVAESDVHFCQQSILDMERAEVPKQAEATEEDTEYEQACANGIWVKLGDCMYVKPFEGCQRLVRVERIWKSNGETWVSGVTMVYPAEVDHEPTCLFYKSEVFATDIQTIYPLTQTSGRCVILSVKDYCSSRPTEIDETHVHVCDSKVIGTNSGKLSVPENSERKFKLKVVQHVSDEVLDDEVFYFKKPITLEKEPSPFLMKRKFDYVYSSPCSHLIAGSPEGSVPEPKVAQKRLNFMPKLTSRSKSGYILFSAVVRKKIMAENPDSSFGHISKIVGSEWKKLSDSEKKRYEEEAQRIAEEREKADVAMGNRLQPLPGQILVHCCRWRECDYQFETVDQLNEHITTAHTSQLVDPGDNQYVCLWLTCAKYRKEGKPFPSLPRLHRHIKEKHLPASGKCVYPHNRSKHYVPLSLSSQSASGDVGSPKFHEHPLRSAPSGQISSGNVPSMNANFGLSIPSTQVPTAVYEANNVGMRHYQNDGTSRLLYDAMGNIYSAQSEGQNLVMYKLADHHQLPNAAVMPSASEGHSEEASRQHFQQPPTTDLCSVLNYQQETTAEAGCTGQNVPLFPFFVPAPPMPVRQAVPLEEHFRYIENYESGELYREDWNNFGRKPVRITADKLPPEAWKILRHNPSTQEELLSCLVELRDQLDNAIRCTGHLDRTYNRYAPLSTEE
ncbi:HMG box and BAH and Bromodomain domain containing protein [Trichuris trichiura]|uniref:HMG box and BAH and Bromodomain domain containing protein n=1 Tax=Trichuris trichiura TaxID=36087 RepID=A0A077ZD10_TRITR|nr:HMG box and BAH and Bromodomain domain containing protein [Trichuris trichiura]